MVGCGNSPFSADMYDAGYKNIVNIDYSENVITVMKKQHSEKRPMMKWLVVDMTDMSELADNSFDVVIDKAAMDAFMTKEGDVWNPEESVVQASYAMCRHIQRVLKPDNGVFIQISLAQPHFRKKYLLGLHGNESTIDKSDESYTPFFGWTFRAEAAGGKAQSGGFGHFLYVMTTTTTKPKRMDT